MTNLWYRSIMMMMVMMMIGPSSMMMSVSIQLVFGFSQQPQGYPTFSSSFPNHERTMRILVANRVQPTNAIVQRFNGRSVKSQLPQRESMEGLGTINDPTRLYQRWSRWYMQKASSVFFQSRKWFRQLRWCTLFLSLFLSWNVAIPKTIAATISTAIQPATTTTLQSIRPKFTDSASDAATPNHNNDPFNTVAPPRDGNSFHSHRSVHNMKRHQRQIRFVTTAAVIVATSAVGIRKVNSREQSIRNSIASVDSTPVNVDDEAVTSASTAELSWLLPKNDDNANTDDGTSISTSSIGPANSSPAQYLSQRNTNTNDISNVVERLKQFSLSNKVTNTANSDRPNDSEKKSASWLMTNQSKKGKSSPTPPQRQQPKSPPEEDLLQAKYASIESLEERAYTILMDLGMVEPPTTTRDPLDSAWE